MKKHYFVRKSFRYNELITVLYWNDTMHYTYCIVPTLPDRDTLVRFPDRAWWRKCTCVLSAQLVVSVFHGQVAWKPHVCVICALLGERKLLQCGNHPSLFPPEKYTCRTVWPWNLISLGVLYGSSNCK